MQNARFEAADVIRPGRVTEDCLDARGFALHGRYSVQGIVAAKKVEGARGLLEGYHAIRLTVQYASYFPEIFIGFAAYERRVFESATRFRFL